MVTTDITLFFQVVAKMSQILKFLFH